MDIITLFCIIDDFFLAYLQYQAKHQLPEIPGTSNTRGRPRRLHPSEVMTILIYFQLIYFHQHKCKNFKTYYQEHVCSNVFRVCKVFAQLLILHCWAGSLCPAETD